MSLSSISSSSSISWRRVRREVVKVFVVLLCLELILRVPPIHKMLSQTFDPYENSLWYTVTMPAYQMQLQSGPDYDLWLVGSSYMMSGLDPSIVQEDLQRDGLEDVTVQNYGMTSMANLEVMGEVFDRWVFAMRQPRYIVLGTSQRNFTLGGESSHLISTSTYENLYIFPDSPDEYVAGFLFKNSVLYRYSILARSSQFVDRKLIDLLSNSFEKGGFTKLEGDLDCGDLRDLEMASSLEANMKDMAGGFQRLDHFIQAIEERHIPVMVVNIPQPQCALEHNGFANYEEYEASYLEPLREHLRQRDITFQDLDGRFHSEISFDTQGEYFKEASHPNVQGSELFSAWTAEFVSSWLDEVSDN